MQRRARLKRSLVLLEKLRVCSPLPKTVFVCVTMRSLVMKIITFRMHIYICKFQFIYFPEMRVHKCDDSSPIKHESQTMILVNAQLVAAPANSHDPNILTEAKNARMSWALWTNGQCAGPRMQRSGVKLWWSVQLLTVSVPFFTQDYNKVQDKSQPREQRQTVNHGTATGYQFSLRQKARRHTGRRIWGNHCWALTWDKKEGRVSPLGNYFYACFTKNYPDLF